MKIKQLTQIGVTCFVWRGSSSRSRHHICELKSHAPIAAAAKSANFVVEAIREMLQ